MAAEARKTGDQALPRRIGRYEAFLQIGAGGMARVYLAVQRGLPGQKAELVVVKMLRPEVVEDEHILALFTDEARIATRLEHPNVIRTREVVADPPDYLLVMDFHNGRSLLDVLNRLGREAVPLDEHVYVLSRVLAGLGYAHELEDESGRPFGIVHRDVSPANVLVSYGGEVKLLDFGIAKATGALVATRDGVVRGKLGYAAPEQCLGQPADPRSDVYAVGVMLWEAVAGRRRVTGETWQSVMQARLEDTEPSLEEVCPTAPPALTAIVRKAIARDPGHRYPTAREFQADLERYLSEERRAKIGPARIAAMLKPHFDKDRVDLQRSVEAFLTTLKSGKSGQPGRIPLPGGRAPAQEAAAEETSRPTAPVVQEETTAPIPVDTALLVLSRGEETAAPQSSVPTAPPPRAPQATTAPPPPHEPMTTTAPPPPDAVVPSAALPSLEPGSFPVETTRAPEPVAVAAAPAPKRAPLAVDAYGVAIAPNAAAAPGWPSGSVAPPPKKKSLLLPFLLLGAGAIGLAAVVVVPRLDSAKKSAARAPEPKAAADPSPKAAAPSAAQNVPMVKVRISVDPADAEVKLDGVALSGNPFVATLPRDNAPHQLTAVAEGCTDHQQAVRLNGDLRLLIAMKCQRQGFRTPPKPGAKRPAGAAPAPAAPAAPQPPAEPASEPISPDNPYK